MKAAIYSQKKDLDTFLYLSKFISELENRGVQSVLFDEMAESLQFSKIFETFERFRCKNKQKRYSKNGKYGKNAVKSCKFVDKKRFQKKNYQTNLLILFHFK